MSDSIFSPDGKFLWTGSEWIPAPPQEIDQINESPIIQSGDITDSVVMGDVDNSTTVVVNQHTGDIENYLRLMLESFVLGNFQEAKNYFKEARKINTKQTDEIYNEKYRETVNEIRLKKMVEYCASANPPDKCGGCSTLFNKAFLFSLNPLLEMYDSIKSDGEREAQYQGLIVIINWCKKWYGIFQFLTVHDEPIVDFLRQEFSNCGQSEIADVKIEVLQAHIKEQNKGIIIASINKNLLDASNYYPFVCFNCYWSRDFLIKMYKEILKPEINRKCQFFHSKKCSKK